MKKIVFAVVVTVLSLGSFSFAEDVFKNFERLDSSPKNERPLGLGVHFAVGFGSFWDYPSEYGDNDWFGASLDIGCVLRYRINNLFALVPEVNFGFNISSREVGEGSAMFSDYTVSESRTVFFVDVPLVLRYSPVYFLYLETGGRLNFNLGTSHSLKKSYDNSSVYDNSSAELDKWNVKSFVPSLIFGLGGTIRPNGHEFDVGLRLVLDVGHIEKNDKLHYYDEDADEIKTFENKTKNFAIQLLFNFYFI